MIHLHLHTHYSLLDGLISPEKLAQKLLEINMPGAAITDHGTCYGLIDFYQTMRAHGLKPILGVELYYVDDIKNKTSDRYHITAIAKNTIGYKNILVICSLAQKYFYKKPIIDLNMLRQYSEGLIVLSGCPSGKPIKNIDRVNEVVDFLKLMGDIFNDDFYVEIQRNTPEYIPQYNQLIDIAKMMGYPIVATNDVHYINRGDHMLHTILTCVQTKDKLNSKSCSNAEVYLKTRDEMLEAFHDVPEAVENTMEIFEKCENIEIELAPPYHLPRYENSSSISLIDLCIQELKNTRGIDIKSRPDLLRRLEYETEIIEKMGFKDYFLIVKDVTDTCRTKNIWWNVRGSGAGSAVAYALGITHVDPLKYKLMFERFLNPGRISMPDIDIDVQADRRSEIINYIINKYHKENVASIITFGALGARAAFRDVCRVLNVPLTKVNRITSMLLPTESIMESIETNSELRELYEKDEEINTAINYAAQIEGCLRHASTHAAGLVIADQNIMNYVPLHRPTNSSEIDDNDKQTQNELPWVSQYEMTVLDSLGLLKIDVLGLKTLSQMSLCCELIKKRHGIVYDIHSIPYDYVHDTANKKLLDNAYKLLSDGNTIGVFQVESEGMRKILSELKPKEFNNIVTILALYRPGPIDHIPSYIRRYNGEEVVVYYHPKLKNILQDTLGICIFQEQIMQIAVELAGYDVSEADSIRKAVSKKKKDLMEQHHKKFINGCVNNNIPEDVAQKIWQDIEFFAKYGFNRAHATDYAMIAVQTAFLKSNYSIEFFTSLLTIQHNNLDDIKVTLQDAINNGIRVKKPDVNISEVDFSIQNDSEGEYISYGLNAIKNLGSHAQTIVQKRQEGNFLSLNDFIARTRPNKRQMEVLIKSGALDNLIKFEKPPYNDPIFVLNNTEDILKKAYNTKKKSKISGSDSIPEQLTLGLFIDQSPKIERSIPENNWFNNLENVTAISLYEREVLGISFTSPTVHIEKTLLVENLVQPFDTILSTNSGGITVVCLVSDIRITTTNKSNTMCFIEITNGYKYVTGIVFPDTYKKYEEIVKNIHNTIVIIKGKITKYNNRKEIIIEKIFPQESVWKLYQEINGHSYNPSKPVIIVQGKNEILTHTQDAHTVTMDSSIKNTETEKKHQKSSPLLVAYYNNKRFGQIKIELPPKQEIAGHLWMQNKSNVIIYALSSIENNIENIALPQYLHIPRDPEKRAKLFSVLESTNIKITDESLFTGK